MAPARRHPYTCTPVRAARLSPPAHSVRPQRCSGRNASATDPAVHTAAMATVPRAQAAVGVLGGTRRYCTLVLRPLCRATQNSPGAARGAHVLALAAAAARAACSASALCNCARSVATSLRSAATSNVRTAFQPRFNRVSTARRRRNSRHNSSRWCGRWGAPPSSERASCSSAPSRTCAPSSARARSSACDNGEAKSFVRPSCACTAEAAVPT